MGFLALPLACLVFPLFASLSVCFLLGGLALPVALGLGLGRCGLSWVLSVLVGPCLCSFLGPLGFKPFFGWIKLGFGFGKGKFSNENGVCKGYGLGLGLGNPCRLGLVCLFGLFLPWALLLLAPWLVGLLFGPFLPLGALGGPLGTYLVLPALCVCGLCLRRPSPTLWACMSHLCCRCGSLLWRWCGSLPCRRRLVCPALGAGVGLTCAVGALYVSFVVSVAPSFVGVAGLSLPWGLCLLSVPPAIPSYLRGFGSHLSCVPPPYLLREGAWITTRHTHEEGGVMLLILPPPRTQRERH